MTDLAEEFFATYEFYLICESVLSLINEITT